MLFSVTILGSGAALPTAQRNPTSQYIECNNRHILIDCGEGTQMQIRKAGVKLQKITHILISHLHGDHFFGLVGLLSSMHLLGRNQGLTIYGPAGLEQIIRIQLEVGGSKLDFSLDFIPLFGNENKLLFEDKMIEIHTFPLKHKIPTNGFLIKEKQKERSIIGEVFRASGLSLMAIPFFRKGKNFVDDNGEEHFYEDYTFPAKSSKSYAFCSDTKYTETIIPYISEVDVLYHEATFTEKELDRARATMHSTAKQAAQIAQKANVKKLLLGHLSARFENDKKHMAEAKEIFDNVMVVKDLDVVIL
jgi:ribonuclease Z